MSIRDTYLGKRLSDLLARHAITGSVIPAIANEIEIAEHRTGMEIRDAAEAGYELAKSVADSGAIAKVNFPEMLRKAGRADFDGKVEVPVEMDQFNESDKGNRKRGWQGGPLESSSGSGADRMVGHYSPDADKNQSDLTEGYVMLARELTATGKRVEGMEDAIKAMSGLLVQLVTGKSVPSDSTGSNGGTADEDESRENEDEDGSDPEFEKSGALRVRNVGSVANLMRGLQKTASGSNGRFGIQQAPNFSIVKATPIAEDDDSIEGKALRARQHAARNGAPIPAEFLRTSANHMRGDGLASAVSLNIASGRFNI